MNAIEAITMLNQSLLIEKIKNDLPLQMKSNQITADDLKALTRTEAPIDLSRRCDSVETRKTPSPYNSSAFGESSPSMMNESPSSMSRSSCNRSDTPTNRYQSAAYLQTNFSPSSRDLFESERSPSPPLHRFMREQSFGGKDDEINPYILHAIQQKLQNSTASASKSEKMSDNSLQYPMILGSNGKIARPFKAYPRDPLSVSAMPPTTLLGDEVSSERFNMFRQQMLDQIHAANGGHPTVTNPRMRRVSAKSFGEQEQQQADAQNQTNTQSDSSSSGPISGKDKYKDIAYLERRRRNNAAAKKSRDRRKIKEDEIAIRAAFLERENFELKIELATAQRQLASFMEKRD